MGFIYLFFLSLITFASVGFAQVKATTENGRKIIVYENGTWKLDKPTQEKTEYENIAVDDLVLDMSSLKGKKVKFTGYGGNGSVDYVFVGKTGSSTNLVTVYYSTNLAREKKKWVINNCDYGCKITVYGTVTRGGVIAENITW